MSESPALQHPTATIQDLMVAFVDPSADAIWDSVGTVVTAAGADDRRPVTEAEWQRLRVEALRLVESSNLLLMPDRAVAAPGTRTENPGIELQPEQTQSLIDADPRTWAAMVDALYLESLRMLKAIDNRDADAVFQQGEALDLACEACHRRYWYPEDAAFFQR